MNTSRFHRTLRFTFPLLALILVLGLMAGCNGYKDTFVPPSESTEDGSTTADATTDDAATEDATTEPTDTSAEETSTDTTAEETSKDEPVTEEETTAPDLTTYTVTVTNACGTPLSGILVTVYEDSNLASIINGITAANGTYTFDAVDGSYHATAVRTGPASIADTAYFEEGSTTLTIVLGDHPINCPCFDTEEETTAVEEPAE